jgi:uncharacterized protein (DUF433 family)
MKSSETETIMPPAEIHDRGRGPEIKGTRITVYDILEYLIGAWSKDRIAELYRLSVEQVQAAIDYISEHDLEVLRDYVQILERIRRGNPPELQAKLDARHEQFQELKRQIDDVKARGEAEIAGLIRKYRESAAPATALGEQTGPGATVRSVIAKAEK